MVDVPAILRVDILLFQFVWIHRFGTITAQLYMKPNDKAVYHFYKACPWLFWVHCPSRSVTIFLLRDWWSITFILSISYKNHAKKSWKKALLMSALIYKLFNEKNLIFNFQYIKCIYFYKNLLCKVFKEETSQHLMKFQHIRWKLHQYLVWLQP